MLAVSTVRTLQPWILVSAQRLTLNALILSSPFNFFYMWGFFKIYECSWVTLFGKSSQESFEKAWEKELCPVSQVPGHCCPLTLQTTVPRTTFCAQVGDKMSGCSAATMLHSTKSDWRGWKELSYHLEPVGWVGLIYLLVIPGREEKKSLCPGAPCPFLDLRGGGWGVNRVIALLLTCLMPLSLSTYNARGFCCPGDMNQDQTLTCQWIMLV